MVEENGSYYSDGWGYRRSASFFGTANYAFKGRYIVNGTMRYEGSNQLGRSNKSRWLPTWNVSGAWNASDEKWFKNPVVSYAKARISYSLTADRGPSSVSNALPIF